jgi:hypothetical protein
MKRVKSHLTNFLFTICVLFAGSCSGAEINNPSSEIRLVGSTPGDALIKSLLTIDTNTKVDFISWDLTLIQADSDSNQFILNVIFGEAQPNTTGFKNGGEKRSFIGKYTLLNSENESLHGEVYQLKSKEPSTNVSIIKLNDNLYHILTPGNNLMIGNGGWSYTLNRKHPLVNISSVLPSLTLFNDTARQVTFDGRTPCTDFARQYDYKVSNDCIKLKWRLILYRDPITLLPTTYIINWTLSRINTEGKWSVKKGEGLNADAVIIQLDPDKPDKSISFLAGDENVLFFLDKKNELLTGNSHFSYTLNKIKK